MGFPTLWRKWIKECVCTATASVLVNGSPTDEFPLERGLRQGDPLSPFLFLLAVEGLHVLMEAMVERNLFTGYSVGDITPVSVSHLQFADDTLLLGSKSWANVRALRAVLVLFESMSGLRVNFNKSMLVGVNIPDSWLGEAASALCCKVEKIPFLYLGLPIGGKWCWRMLVDREGLWFRVLVGRYGVERGRLCVGGTRGSTWWRELASLQDGGGTLDEGWFGGHISRK
ncbi:ribonuclease H, partial [Trifolium pratense]